MRLAVPSRFQGDDSQLAGAVEHGLHGQGAEQNPQNPLGDIDGLGIDELYNRAFT